MSPSFPICLRLPPPTRLVTSSSLSHTLFLVHISFQQFLTLSLSPCCLRISLCSSICLCLSSETPLQSSTNTPSGFFSATLPWLVFESCMFPGSSALAYRATGYWGFFYWLMYVVGFIHIFNLLVSARVSDTTTVTDVFIWKQCFKNQKPSGGQSPHHLSFKTTMNWKLSVSLASFSFHNLMWQTNKKLQIMRIYTFLFVSIVTFSHILNLASHFPSTPL